MLRIILGPLLRPIMRLVLYRTDRKLAQLPFPVDSPHVHASGTDPDRVLLFGSGAAVGYGVLSHDLALPGHVARQLSAITGRGVDLDVVADPEVTIQESVSLLSEINLWRYDAILLTIGANNALMLTSITVWRSAIRELLTHVNERVPRNTRVLIVAVPPLRLIDSMSRFSAWLADRHSVTLNRETRKIVAQYPHMIFVPFSPLATADDIHYRSASMYQRWATIIVAPLGGQLAAQPRISERDIAKNEHTRQAAVNELKIIGTDPEPRFDRITELAAQLFGTPFAAIAFVDADRIWLKSAHNFDVNTAPRSGSFCDWALTAPGAFIVTDALNDPRFAHNEHVRSGGLRFWAGYPIESSFGERVGMICISALEPRTWSLDETDVLRDLALHVQRELNADKH